MVRDRVRVRVRVRARVRVRVRARARVGGRVTLKRPHGGAQHGRDVVPIEARLVQRLDHTAYNVL